MIIYLPGAPETGKERKPVVAVTAAGSGKGLAAARRGGKRKAKAQLSRIYRPEAMALDDWQRELRRQFGREQKFRMENLGNEPVFSAFRVFNPQSRSAYRVTIRGGQAGVNHCTCADFATSRLGTCKHIEFVLAKLRRQRGGARALAAGYVPAFGEVVLHYGSQREVRFCAGADCPEALRRESKRFFAGEGVLKPEAFGRFEEFLALSAKAGHEIRCREDALAFVAEVRDGEARRRRVDRAFPQGIRSAGFEKLVKGELYDYQKEGALFAARAGRCLIADDMGLGKTAQALAAAEILARCIGIARVLVICPTSLKHQWQREIAQFTSRPAQVIQGLRTRRQALFGGESFFKITNYDTVHADLDLIAVWAPDLVILDEAQRIKNWNTRAARSVKKIVSPHAIVLTGTPLENRLEELVSIVEFVDRHRLGPTHRFLANHQTLDEFGKVVGYRDLEAIGRTLSPILLRRRKAEVLRQLPKRMDKNLFVPMTPEQQRHHTENREVVARIVNKWRRYKYLSETDRQRLMIALQNMRMSCNSTYLLDQETDYGTKVDELVAQLDGILENGGEKVVVFSQWQRTHELIARRLRSRRYGFVQFNGSVPGPARKALVDRFREDEKCRVFLSTDAGGVGLNLQHAAVVVNMDVPWNPAVLEQRIGRVHRLGQRRAVRVINFVAQGTIEEGMLSVLKFKKSLFTGALDGGENDVFLGGSRLTRFMETVDKATGAIPEAEAVETAEPADVGGAETTVAAAAPDSSEEARRERGDGAPEKWGGLIEAGMAFLRELAEAARREKAGGGAGGNAPAAARKGLVRRDSETGASYLHLPMPRAEVVERLLGAAQEFLGAMHGA